MRLGKMLVKRTERVWLLVGPLREALDAWWDRQMEQHYNFCCLKGRPWRRGYWSEDEIRELIKDELKKHKGIE